MDSVCLHRWENASEDWWMGATVTPISREAMQAFADGTHDLYRDRQLRLMLDHSASGDMEGDRMTVGALDLYDFEPRHRRAGIGVYIDPRFRRQGHAIMGLTLLVDYARLHLGLHQLFAEVPVSNASSMDLFRKLGFLKTGERRDWIRTSTGSWANVATFQQLWNEPLPQ